MPYSVQDLQRRDGESVRFSSGIETHERAQVRIEVDQRHRLTVLIDTASGFVAPPLVVLQRENGSRERARQTQAVNDAAGRLLYSAAFDVQAAYLDGMIDVRGTAQSGLVTSAVEGFVFARYEELGTFQLFGPRGFVAVQLIIEEDPDGHAVWIGPAPSGLPRPDGELLPASPAFTIGSTLQDRFPGQTRISLPVDLSARDSASGEDRFEVAVYRLEDDGRWAQVSDDGWNHVHSLVGADIEHPGAYAAFARERQRDDHTVREENAELQRVITAQQLEIRNLTRQLDRYQDGLRALVLPPQAGAERDALGRRGNEDAPSW